MSERITAGFIDSFPLSETHSFLCASACCASYLPHTCAHPALIPHACLPPEPRNRTWNLHLDVKMKKKRGGRRKGDSQFGHVPGDAFGQRVKMLVAAAHHRLQASALAGTLRLGHAARLLLAWEKRKGVRQVERKMKERVTIVWGGRGGWRRAKSRGRGRGKDKSRSRRQDGGRTEPNGAIRHADDEAFRQIKSRK